jgi:transcription antitermination factor NusG
MIGDRKQWYALYLRSRYEKKVYEDLGKKETETFLPLIEEVHVWSDRKKKVLEPLFRGYIFVKTDLRDKENILLTDGVVRFVGINHKPSSIPESQIDWLRRLVYTSNDVQREHYLNVGERVRIITGPLTGVEGIVHRNRGISRVIVSIAAIEQSISVQVPAEHLEVIHTIKG